MMLTFLGEGTRHNIHRVAVSTEVMYWLRTELGVRQI